MGVGERKGAPAVGRAAPSVCRSHAAGRGARGVLTRRAAGLALLLWVSSLSGGGRRGGRGGGACVWGGGGAVARAPFPPHVCVGRSSAGMCESFSPIKKLISIGSTNGRSRRHVPFAPELCLCVLEAREMLSCVVWLFVGPSA